MDNFLSIAIIGTLLSIVFQKIKTTYGVDSLLSKLIMLGLSIMLGSAYYYLSQLEIWKSILGILASASTVYAMFYSSVDK